MKRIPRITCSIGRVKVFLLFYLCVSCWRLLKCTAGCSSAILEKSLRKRKRSAPLSCSAEEVRSSGAAPSYLSNSRSCGQPLATPRRSRRQAGERSAFPWSPARHVSRSLQQLEVCEHSGAPCTELCVLKRRKQELLFFLFFPPIPL